MGLFDFLKKKELDEITKLNSIIDRLDSELNECVSTGNKLTTELDKYRPIIDIEAEAQKKLQELDAAIETKRQETEGMKSEFAKLNSDYINALEIYKKVRHEVSLFENQLDLIEFGLHSPIYDFEKSDKYREEQNIVIEELKSMIQDDTAAYCTTTWTVSGSEAKGRKVVKVYKKLLLRAFNGEADVLIAKVKWNNINQMKERMVKIFNAINKLGEGFEVYISQRYLDYKLEQLILEYEYLAKKQQEKEELKAIQDELREEEKARRDFERAQREAEKQESMYQKALDRVRKDFELANGPDAEKLKSQIQQLELELQEAHNKKERALSMAQQTKRGHVYIISNIGAFGEDVYKIGMTRRLEPLDRVRELGDASVPFQFDIHAMIYSDEARTLEYELHKAFADRKVNMLNNRKEFFKVTLDEIGGMIKELGFEAEMTVLPEAMEYRETLAILEKLNNPEEIKTMDEMISEEFPASLLSN